jgi:flagellar capping protein FliD
MITQVQFGNLYNSGGRTVLGGGNSGYDTEALIKGLTEARRLPAVKLEDELELNGKKQTALSQLRDIIGRYKDAANFLRNPPGVNNASQNIFKYRNATLTSNTTISAANYLSVTAEPGATVADYQVTVNALATRNVKTTATFALADLNTAAVGATPAAGRPFNAGSLRIGPNNVFVDLAAGDTLAQVVQKINAVKDDSGVEATAIKVSNGNYRLQFKTLETGTAQNYEFDHPYTTPGFFATDAIMRLDAHDIDGDGSQLDNPAVDTPINAAGDITGSTSFAATGADQTLRVRGEYNLPEINFSGVSSALQATNTAAINTGGPYNQKTFALSFTAGSDITGTQTVYMQGDGTRSFAVYIAPDPGNSNAPTLFAVAHNTAEWDVGSQSKVLNLGTVTAGEHYNLELSFDASANPTANDPANFFRGYINGSLVDGKNGVRQMPAMNGAIAVGGTIGGAGLPDGTSSVGDGNYFKGSINEVVLTNTVLDSTQRTALNDYFSDRYSTPPSSVFNVAFALEEDAVDASLTVDGTTITRATNSIDDLFEGLTFNLIQETPALTEIDVDVKPDTEIIKNGIVSFIDSYNEFRLFVERQRETNVDGSFKEDALLGNSATMRSILNRVYEEMSRGINGLASGDPSRLGDLGITFSDFPGDEETPFTRNIMKLDEDKLDSAIAADFDAVRRVFEFDYTSDNSDLQIFSRTNSLAVNNISLAIDLDAGGNTFIATYDLGAGPQTTALTGTAITGGGYILKGAAGSVLEGLELIYSGSTDATINLDITQGIGDRLWNALDGVLDDDNGMLTLEEAGIDDRNSRIESEITRIDEIVERYREQLLEKFSALERALASINTILQSLDAQSRAQNNN